MNFDIVRLEVVKEKTIEYANESLRNSSDLANIGFKLIGNADREILISLFS